jgi:hypothetical protein
MSSTQNFVLNNRSLLDVEQSSSLPATNSLTDSLFTSSQFSSSATSLLFIDTRVVDYQNLIENVASGTEVHILDTTQDAIAQITQVLLGRSGISSLHIVSHGEVGSLALGNNVLNLDSAAQYADQIQSWQQAFTTDADVLLYGCNVAAGEAGQAFVESLSQLTQADVAASIDLTGAAALGADWDLEFTTGQLESPLAFGAETQSAYAFTLATLVNESFTNADVNQPTWLFGNSGSGAADPILTARTGAASPGGIPGGTTAIDPAGQGFLRLTNNAQNQGSFVIYNQAFTASGGVSIQFESYQYGGTGADGISFFLVDGNVNPTQAGQLGGGLGYNGIAGGYLGIGIDAFGNFSTPGIGGTGGPGRTPDSVVIRGSQASGYQYLTGRSVATTGSIDVPQSAGGSRANSRRIVKIDITQQGLVTVQIDLDNDGVFEGGDEQPILNFDVTAANANNAPLPSTFKLGFAASTGSSTNFHEIRTLQVNSILPIVDFPSNTLNINENAGTLSVPITLSEVSAIDISIPFTIGGTATNGVDYTPITNTIVIRGGTLGGNIPILNLIDDGIVEPNETITIQLDPTIVAGIGLNNPLTVTVVDSGSLTLVENCDDFNGDGFSDLVWRDYAQGNNVIWLMNRTTPVTAVPLLSVPGANWVIEGTCDYNSDAQADIVWRDYASGRNVIWLMNGTTPVVAAELVTVADSNWRIEGTSDFNDDRKPDLLWRNYATGQNLLWLMEDTISTIAIDLVAVPDGNWIIEAANDFNGDRRTDIVWRNTATGENLIWLMENTVSTVAIATTAVPDGTWALEEAVDLDGDGNTDLIWRNFVTNENLIWLMNDAASVQAVSLVNVPGNNWHVEDLLNLYIDVFVV